MNDSTFWVLYKKNKDKLLPGAVRQLKNITILELTEDGMAFLWPAAPERLQRCSYCQRFPGFRDSDVSKNAQVNTLGALKAILGCTGDVNKNSFPKLVKWYTTPLKEAQKDLTDPQYPEPDRTALKNMLSHIIAAAEGREDMKTCLESIGCLPAANSAYPCSFQPDPDSEHQDLESYMLYGECEDAGGYYKNLHDFFLCQNYHEDDFLVTELGSHPNIAAARSLWITSQNYYL